MTKLLTVTELAHELGVTARAIRFYEDKGLISPQRVGNRRVYSNRDRGRLVLILRGKRLGFSLREIRDWLTLYDTGPDQVEQMKRLLALTRDRMATLEAQYDDLEATIEELRDIETEVVEHLKVKAGSDDPEADDLYSGDLDSGDLDSGDTQTDSGKSPATDSESADTPSRPRRKRK